ncbi:MAG: hypothetical protein H7339_05045 [Arcicella sp.]|nr:hypothetical protein [Arcicella sp.]
MKPTKELVTILFEQKNRKRRAMLYQLFQDFFSLNVTAEFMAEMLSKELKSDSTIISADDIYFIRQYYHNKPSRKISNNSIIIHSKKADILIPGDEKSIDSDELVWTDIDALPQSNKFRQTK